MKDRSPFSLVDVIINLPFRPATQNQIPFLCIMGMSGCHSARIRMAKSQNPSSKE
jgi:hypothetical protein